MNFSKEQLVFIAERTRHVATVAVPGAGKTESIKQKICEMLADGGTVIGVTFTCEAADALRKRTFAAIPEAWQSRCQIGTFHALALKALGELEDSPTRGRVIMDDAVAKEQRTIALEAVGVDATPEHLAWFERAYTCIDDPFGFVTATALPVDDPTREAQVRLAEQRYDAVLLYEEGLHKNGLTDMSRILLTALEFVQAGHPLFVADHLVVDEFQDVDPVQLKLILMLPETIRVDVMGDDDQSVYRFRHGLGFAAFHAFRKERNPRWLQFTKNYRCRPEILRWADGVISQNVHRYPKTLIANKSPGADLKLGEMDFEAQENALVAQMAFQALQRGMKSVAIIARTNAALVDIQPVLTPLVEFHRVKCKSIWELVPCSTVVSLLECLAAPSKHWVGLEHALHLFGAHGSEITRLRNAADGGPIIQAPGVTTGTVELSAAGMQATSRLTALLARLGYPTPPAAGEATDRAISEVFTEAVDAVLCLGDKTEKQRAATAHLLEAAERALEQLQGSLAQRLQVVRRALENDENAPVTLTTMHSAKGLEFDAVFIIRAAESVLLGKARTEEDVEEERRLLYVAMTRARDALTITCARQYGLSRWARKTHLTRLLYLEHSPRIDSFDDWAWMLRH